MWGTNRDRIYPVALIKINRKEVAWTTGTNIIKILQDIQIKAKYNKSIAVKTEWNSRSKIKIDNKEMENNKIRIWALKIYLRCLIRYIKT